MSVVTARGSGAGLCTSVNPGSSSASPVRVPRERSTAFASIPGPLSKATATRGTWSGVIPRVSTPPSLPSFCFSATPVRTSRLSTLNHA